MAEQNSEYLERHPRTAYLFPGQGSQAVGMGKDLSENFALARAVFEEADDALGFSLSKMCFEGDESDLQLTANTQPAILTVSTALYRVARAEGLPTPDFAAGHSLGEYSALVAAESLDFAEAVRTVRNRGSYMQDAVPVGVGGMAAIMGLDLDGVVELCAEAANGQVCSPANINSPSQIVIAGNTEAVDRACEIAKAKGAKRAIKLNVSAPFHCDLMRPAQERLKDDLGRIGYAALAFPVVHNIDAEPNTDAGVVAAKLEGQVSSSVKWLQTIRRLSQEGVGKFVEIGPGKVLTGLVRQIEKDATYSNIENTQSLRENLS
ncbi:MAG: ACP S-malonyltransferase [Acidobacteria bacterium OLB17]|nr:MAG: ACP S-malonyltransferase [Acidobacteria bacterium OLB17]MCZ2389627.1 ACP S-malonyltransferase [Acidobacteriota bacterium]